MNSTSEMMLTVAGGTDTQSSSDSWNDMNTGLSRIRRLYEKAILSEIEAAVQMNSIITAAIAKHVMTSVVSGRPALAGTSMSVRPMTLSRHQTCST